MFLLGILVQKIKGIDVFIAHRAIPINCFPKGSISLNIYVSIVGVCIVYVVKEVASFPGVGFINGRGT